MVPVSVELFAYPWDIVDSGVEPFVEYCSQAGIHRIHAAVTYHSGKFLLPRNSRSRIYFPEPGARYFRDSGTPGNGGLSQPVSSLADTGWLESLATEAYGKGIELSAWTVFFHNSAVGSQYPDLVTQNAFGDKYPFALCPAQPAVRDHAAALCRSLRSLGFFSSIDLETVGYLGYSHGYHHEVTAVPLGLPDKFLLSICFCPACSAAGHAAGIEMETLAAEVRRLVSHRMRCDDVPAGSHENAEQLATLLVLYPELVKLIRLRMETVTSLIKRLSQECKPMKVAAFTSGFVGSPSNIWMEGISLRGLKEIVDCFHLLAYAPEVNDSDSDLLFLLALIETAEKLNWTVNLGLPITSFGQAFAKCEYALRRGVRRFSFFNYGLLGEMRLKWLQNLASAISDFSI